jgi:adenylate cyclase
VNERNKGYLLGASDYLVKPVESDQLLAAIRRVSAPPVARVLHVDDDARLRRWMRQVLAWEGIDVNSAESGDAALRGGRPDLIVLDLIMPNMDGFEFLQRLGTSPGWGAIPVIVVTAKDLTLEERARLGPQARQIVSKSDAPMEEVRRHIRQIVSAGNAV